MSTDAVPMSQWPSDQRYVIPVAPGPDLVTVTIDGKEVQAPRGELLIKVAQEHGTYIPRFCWHERMKPVGMCRMCLVEVEGMRGMQISCATPVTDGMVVNTQSDEREGDPGRRARVPADQPPARLPGVRPRRRVPAAGPDPCVRSGRVAVRRGEAPLREADPDQRSRAPRPRALHPVRPLHALRRRDRRRPAHRLRRARRRDAGHHLSRRAVHVLLLRQHGPDLPGGRAHRVVVPLPRPAVGPPDGRDVVPDVRGRLPRRAAEHVEPDRAAARRRLRAGEPGLAVRQGSLRLRVGALRRARARADGAQERRAGRGVVARGARRRGRRPAGGARHRGPVVDRGARRRPRHQRGRVRVGAPREGRARHRQRRRPARRRSPRRGRARPSRRDHRRPRHGSRPSCWSRPTSARSCPSFTCACAGPRSTSGCR